MSRSGGKVETSSVRRAASALLFCAAALAALIFPEGAAGGVLPGFAPAQTDMGALVDYNDPGFCEQRGGTVEDADNGQQVCSGVDANDTFCILNSADAFPCRGLFKHVILCNGQYNRPTLNPFFCGRVCDDPVRYPNFPVQALGKKCMQLVTPAVVVSAPAATIYAAAGYTGAAATVETLEGYTLKFDPPAGNIIVAGSSGGYVIEISPPGARALATLRLTAEIACADCVSGVSLTIESVLVPVPAPPPVAAFINPGEALSGAAFNPPSLSDYPGLSNPVFADADTDDEFTVAPDGRVTGTPAAGSDLRRVLLGYWTADGMAGALTLTLNLASADTPASRLLDAAFPREAENIIAAAPYNYQGLAGRIHSRDAGVTVLFSPAATDGISLAADGGVYAARPVSRAMRAVFAVTATVLGTEEGARRARRLSVSVEIAPLERVPMIIVNATEGDNLSAVSLLAERAAPTDPRFRGATLRLAANAAPPDGFTRAGDDVLGPVSLAAGDFDIPFEVVGPGFLGDDSFPGVFRLAGNPAAPQELRFNNVGLVRRMWRTEILSDASGQQFNAAYWGRRRGLHFMTAPLGNVRIAEEPLLMRTAPGFETAKRRDPARADSPDTRWSLADYAAFCRAGGDSGLSGRRWRLPTIGEVAALVAPGKNQGADWLPLPRRFGGVGIPGLVPSGNLRIPLPPNDGQDTWGPLPPGLMGAVNAGAPIVPGNDAGNTPTSGKLWAAGIAQGGYRAFLPWESRESRASSQGWTRLFQGAVGYAACVVEAEDSYQPQPRLAVMEFSYAGKEKRCQISASPTEHCNEAGDFRSVGFVDSSLLDESELQISAALAAVAPSAASSARVFKVVTARALHFGGVNGAAEISSLPGEAALAEISVIASGADAPGLTMVLLSSDRDKAVYAVSLLAEAAASPGLHQAVFAAHPRVGREALLKVAVRVGDIPPPEAEEEPPAADASRKLLLDVGPHYTGALLTIDLAAAVRENPNPAFSALVSLAVSVFRHSRTNAILSQEILLRDPLTPSQSGAYVEALISENGQETTLAVWARLREYPTLRLNLGVVESSVLATLLPLQAGDSYADADSYDDFAIKANGEIHLGHGQRETFLVYHQRITITANIVRENGRGLFRVVEIAANGPDAPPPPGPPGLPAGVHYVHPLVPRPNSNPHTRAGRGDAIPDTVPRRVPLFIPGQRFVLAPDYVGEATALFPVNADDRKADPPPARAVFPFDLPRGFSAQFGECGAPAPGVSLQSTRYAFDVNAPMMPADHVFFSCPLVLVFKTPGGMDFYRFNGFVEEIEKRVLPGGGTVAVAWFRDDALQFEPRYYERLLEHNPPAPTQVEMIRLRPSTVTATVVFRAYPRPYRDTIGGVILTAGDRLRNADERSAAVPVGAAVVGADARAAVWRALGSELKYGTVIAGPDYFKASKDGRLYADKYPELGTLRLTMAATAEGLLGELELPVEAVVIPARRLFDTQLNVGGLGVFYSVPLAAGRRAKATPLAARILAENGLRGAMSKDGTAFKISPISPLGASDCLRANFRLEVFEGVGGEFPAEFVDVYLQTGGAGAECSFTGSGLPASRKTAREIVRVSAGTTGTIWSGWLPIHATVIEQVDAPDLSAQGLRLTFEEGQYSGDNRVQGHLAFMEGRGMTLVGERREARFTLTVYRGAARAPTDVAALWEADVKIHTDKEYNVLFRGAPGGQLRPVNLGIEYVFIPGVTDAAGAEDFWRAPPYYFANLVHESTVSLTSPIRYPGRIIAPDGSFLSGFPAIPGEPTGASNYIEEQSDYMVGGIRWLIRIAKRNESGGGKFYNVFNFLEARAGHPGGAGRFQITMYSDAARTMPEEVINVYYIVEGAGVSARPPAADGLPQFERPRHLAFNADSDFLPPTPPTHPKFAARSGADLFRRMRRF